MNANTQQVTALLNQWARGDEHAGEKVFPLVYEELRRLARRSMKRQGEAPTVQTTVLVHEAYLRLTGDSGTRWETRGHFYGVAAKAMRHFLVDYARAKTASKRGGHCKPLAFDDALLVAEDRLPEVLLLDDALNALAKLHPRQSQVVELRFFAGLDVGQTAQTLNISPETVARDWRAAKAWLYSELARRGTGE